MFGNTARIDFRVKLHADQRMFSPDLRRLDPFDFRRARVGVEGDIKNNAIEYELEYDLREEDYPLRDAFVDVRARRTVQIRGGKFKVPFSRDELTGAMNLDFAFRSRAADQLAPGRSFGGMVHGRVLDRRLQYQVGLFRGDGENARPDPVRLDEGPEGPVEFSGDDSWRARPTWAARSTFEIADDFEIAAATTRSPRAAVIVPNGERVVTFGANWSVNRFIRVVGNVIREHLDDAARAPVPAQQNYWSTIVRLQFVL